MKSNIKSVYKYDIYTVGKPTLIYYGIVITSVIFLLVLNLFDRISFNVNGFEFSTFIFVFVVAIADFKENFEMLIHNNVSRKNIFMGKALVFTTLALAMTFTDRIIITITSLMTKQNENVVFGSIFEEFFKFQNTSVILKQVYILGISFTGYMTAIAVGTLISVLFYRANKLGRVLIAAGIPIFIFIVLPIVIGALMETTIGNSIYKVISALFKSPLNLTAALLLTSIILGSFTWLSIRRATVKSK